MKAGFNTLLREHHLLFEMDVSLRTTCLVLLEEVSRLMENSPYHYVLGVINGLQKLTFLGLMNSGRPDNNNQIGLRRMPTPSGTVVALMTAGKRWFNSSLVEDGRFVIHLSTSKLWIPLRHGLTEN